MKNCYKRILIMFVMVLTIMSVGIMKNGIIANAATVGDQLLQPENGWQRFDTCNKKFAYIGSWKYLKEDANHYNNDHETTKIVGDKIKFNFIGTKLRIIATQDGAAANVGGSADVYIDGSKVGSYTNNNTGLQQSKLYFENTSLTNCEHNVEVIVTNVSSYNDGFTWDCIDIDGYLVKANESISLDKSLTLKEGSTKKLTATTTPSAVDIDWSSSDETVAIVDSSGNVKAIKEGQVTITAQIKDTDTKATCIVTVTKKDVPVEPEPTDPEQEYIINTAYAKGDNTNNASGQVSIIFKGVAEAQLKVVKTADVDSVYVGDNFTYTIEVTNTSDKTAKSVVINDSAPNHIQFIPSRVTTTQGTIDSSSTSKSIIVNVGDIPPSGTVTIKIPANVIL
ncbi:DUF11 domain-containing protein [Clostridium botulinum]|nr:Ig-like domain-containing protein [Clostridium botulinum]NFI01802.1 DUF11 domain-containing protein [Clostridium botulinum]NFI64284.1 DUF11 domain-containing protein [Clostridium botulinum]NFI81487.1 DUF11 domain-containing protein [Clostridium botulinum]NFJ44475.1 DUF11 domain-containing protein [Clostridium botulinum]